MSTLYVNTISSSNGSAITIIDQLTASNGIKIGADGLEVTGEISGSSNLLLAGKVEADDAGFGGDVGVSGTLTVATLSVTDFGVLSGSSLQIANKIEADDAGFGGDVGVSGTLTAGSQISGASGLQIAGHAELGTLGVAGSAIFSGTVSHYGSLSASNGIALFGANTSSIGYQTGMDNGANIYFSPHTINGGIDPTITMNHRNQDVDFQVRYDNGTTSENAALFISGSDGVVHIGDGGLRLSRPSNIEVTDGNISGSGMLQIGGAIEADDAGFGGDVGISGTLTATTFAAISASNGIEVTGTMNVGDKIVFDGNITTISSQLTASNGLKVDAGNLVVDESATITGDLSAAAISGSSLQIANKIEADDAGFGGDVGVSGTLTAGSVTVTGDLDVRGTVNTTNHHETELHIADKAILIASGTSKNDGAAALAALDGSGIYVGSTGTLAVANFIYDAGNDSWHTNEALYVSGALETAGVLTATSISASNGLEVTGTLNVGNSIVYDGLSVTLGADANDVVTVAGELTASLGMSIPDDKKLYFGTGFDASIEYDEDGDDELKFAGAAVAFAQAVSFDGNVTLGADASDVTTVTGELTASLGMSIPDDKKLYFGTGFDASVEYDEDGTDELRFAGAAVTFEQAVTFDANVTLGDAASDITTVTGKLTASNGLKVDAGNLVVDENATITGQLTASNGLEVTGTLNVGDKILFDGSLLTVAADLSASSLQVGGMIECDDAGFGGDLGVSGTLTATSFAAISGTSLQLSGKVEADDAGFGGDLGVSGTLTAAAFAAISGTNGIEITGTMNIDGQIVYDGANTVISSKLTASNGLYVDSNSMLGIGTDAPAAALDIVFDKTNSTAAMITNSGSSTNRYGLAISAGLENPGTNGDITWLVLQDADGTNTSLVQYQTGTPYASFQAPSDSRIKTNIAPTRVKGLEVINKIEMSEFKVARKNKPVSDLHRIGFIAQNCEEAYPEMVGEWEEEDYDFPLKTVAPANLMPVVIKAIQELSAEVEKLKKTKSKSKSKK